MPTGPRRHTKLNERHSMQNVDAHFVKFQCPNCGHDLNKALSD
jgi:predicted RNA-binding Zn-ribbon protein involved in translation (DUF1610 family)